MNKKTIVAATAALLGSSVLTAGFENPEKNGLEQFLPDDFYCRIAQGKTSRQFYPPFGDRKSWDGVARTGFKAKRKADLIAEADRLLEQPIPVLSLYDYFRFVTEGDRARFERAYFQRRRDFAALVMAMCLSGNREKYLPKIVDFLGAIMTELYWCNHAHALQSGDPMPPLNTKERVDLFAAETAQQMAFALQILGAELNSLSPRFFQFCRQTALEKVVLPVLRDTGEPPIHWWLNGTNNWNPWCSANVLTAGAILLEDPAQLAQLTRKLNRSCARYLEQYPDDGYCEEGPGYWAKSAVEFFDYCRVLDTMVPGSAEKLFRTLKFRNMGEFGAQMVISGKDQVISADCGHIFFDAGILYDFGCRIQSPLLRKFAWRSMEPDCRRRALTPEEAAVSRFGTGNRLSGLLDFFFKLPSAPEKKPHAKLPAVSFWPGRMGIIRNADGFSAALKGGHNGEPHNHNDLGHFTLYCGACPLVLDLGTGMYSRKNFGSERYTLFYTNAWGHNAIRFGEKFQLYGKQFTGHLTMPDSQTLACDLTQAYPADAGVKKYIRTLVCEADKAVLTDDFLLTENRPAEMTWYTPAEVKKQDRKTLLFEGGVCCKLEGAQCRSIEPVPTAEIPHHWGNKLWRIRIAVDSPRAVCTFTGGPCSPQRRHGKK